jgi:hypothetical protein
MKRLASAPVLIFLLAALPAQAEKPTPPHLGLDSTVSAGELKATPEMWFYDQQLRQYQDPKAMVRQKAEYHAQQRAHRIESMKWFGFSNSRPAVSNDPVNGDYSPHWTSNANYYPSRWNGTNQAYSP